MLTIPTLKELCSHASRDQTRYLLNGIHYDGESFVSTDGHRMMVSKAPLLLAHVNNQAKPGEIYETEAFKLGALKRIDGKYPNFKSLLPDKSKATHVFKLTFPTWLKDVKQSRKALNGGLGIDTFGQFTTGKAVAHFNPAYLAPYAGLEVTVYLQASNDSRTFSPMLIESPCGEWRAVVMPMRGEPRAVEVLKS